MILYVDFNVHNFPESDELRDLLACNFTREATSLIGRPVRVCDADLCECAVGRPQMSGESIV
jgi:hypothetical protein